MDRFQAQLVEVMEEVRTQGLQPWTKLCSDLSSVRVLLLGQEAGTNAFHWDWANTGWLSIAIVLALLYLWRGGVRAWQGVRRRREAEGAPPPSHAPSAVLGNASLHA